MWIQGYLAHKNQRPLGFTRPSPPPQDPHGQVQPVHQKSTCFTQLTSGPSVVQVWSRNVRKSEGTKPASSTVWRTVHRQAHPRGHLAVENNDGWGGRPLTFSSFGCRGSGFGLRVSGVGVRVSGFGFGVLGFGFRVSGFGCGVYLRGHVAVEDAHGGDARRTRQTRAVSQKPDTQASG